MATPSAPTRAHFDHGARVLLSRGSRFKPSVWRLDGDPACIVKDAATVPRGSRFLARWLLRRERRALCRLQGVEGVPQLLGDLDPNAFAQSLLPGKALEAAAFASAPRRRAASMRRIIAQMHQRRVYHLDLRQRQNVLYHGEDGVVLVDFGAAFAPGPLAVFLFGWLLRWVDRQAVLKFLVRHAPEALTQAEARSVLRTLRLRRLWVFSPHQDHGERAAARARLRQCDEEAAD